MALFALKNDEFDDPDAELVKPSARKSADKAESRVIFVIGAPDSDFALVGTTAKLLGLSEFERSFDIERLNYDLLRTLKLDLNALHLMPDNWEKNDLLDSIKDEIKQLARKEIAGKGIFVVNSCNLSRTASLWAECFAASGINVSFVISFNKPTENFLPWLVYNLEAEKNSREYERSFIHMPDFLTHWRKNMRKISSDLDVDFTNWLSTTREQEIEASISAKNITILPQEKRTTPLNVKRLYSALLNSANGRKFDVSVTEELLPDIQLFFAPLIEKSLEMTELKTRFAKLENEVVELRDRVLQPDDDFYEPALDDGTIDKARAEGEKLYLQNWREWALGHKNRQDFKDYPLFSAGAPLADEVADIANSIPSLQLTILDVMSPPITSVGTFLPGKSLRVIATSPYANEFNLALQQAGIKPPVPVTKVLPENLVKTFGTKSIDLIHCREAIEYVKNPVIAIIEMLNVMKDDGAIFLSHQINKASEENFSSLAQWNCVEKGGQFIIWNSWYKFNITRMLAGSYEIDARTYFDFVEVVIRRKK